MSQQWFEKEGRNPSVTRSLTFSLFVTRRGEELIDWRGVSCRLNKTGKWKVMEAQGQELWGPSQGSPSRSLPAFPRREKITRKHRAGLGGDRGPGCYWPCTSAYITGPGKSASGESGRGASVIAETPRPVKGGNRAKGERPREAPPAHNSLPAPCHWSTILKCLLSRSHSAESQEGP